MDGDGVQSAGREEIAATQTVAIKGSPGRSDRGDTFINTGEVKIGNNFNNCFNKVNGGIDRWQANRRDHWDN